MAGVFDLYDQLINGKGVILTIIRCILAFLPVLLFNVAPRVWSRAKGLPRQADVASRPDYRKAAPTPTKFDDLFALTEGHDKYRTFLYSPLPTSGPHTRLISLLPGEGTSPIVCQMLTVDLNTKPRYEALSYLWGAVDDSNKCGILVNGAPFPVGENLWLALYHLRDKTRVQTLWIDAISINQKDELEKATQIREMKNIYSQASTVLAWLGTSNEYLDEAFDTMEALYGIIPRSILYGPPIVFPLTEHAARDLIVRSSGFVDAAVMSFRASPFLAEAMCRIFSVCPYWSRVWIIQEVLLAKDLVICCGDKRFRWEVYSALRPLMHHMLVLALPSRHLQIGVHPIQASVSRLLQTGVDWDKISIAFDTSRAATFDKQRRGLVADLGDRPDLDLKMLLNLCLGAQCGIARDKIYGVLGILDVPDMPIDYEKPMFEVFTDMIQYIKHPRVRGRGEHYDLHTVRFGQIAQALLRGPLVNTHNMTPCFRLAGFHTGTIKHIDTACTSDDSFDDIKAKLEHLFEPFPEATRGIPFPTEYFNDPEAMYAMMDAIENAKQYTKSLSPPTEISPIISKTKSIYESKCMDMIQPWAGGYFRAASLLSVKNGISQDFIFQKMPATISTADIQQSSPPPSTPPNLFLTSTQAFGLCPASSMPGDLIVQFLDSDAAAVLRPSTDPSQGTQYSLVGRAFIGRNGGVDGTVKILSSRSPTFVIVHGNILTEEDIAEGRVMDRVEMLADAETFQYLTQCSNLFT